MKKYLLFLAFILCSCSLFSQDVEYKLNPRTGKFDMVRTADYIRSVVPGGSGIPEAPNDGNQYTRGQLKWNQAFSRKLIRKGIDYTTDYPEIYLDIVNGSDNSVNPLNVATPLKTLEGVIKWCSGIIFDLPYPAVIVHPGDYATPYTGVNQILSSASFEGCGATYIMFRSKLNNDAGTANVTVYDDNVIFPRIYGNSKSLYISIRGLKIRPYNNRNQIATSLEGCNVIIEGCTCELAPIGNQGFFLIQGSALIRECRLLGGANTLPYILSVGAKGLVESNYFYNNTINMSYTVSNATVLVNGGVAILGRTANNPFLLGTEVSITGKKYTVSNAGTLFSLVIGKNLEEIIPGSIAGTNVYSTSFDNPETINQLSETNISTPNNSSLLFRGKPVPYISGTGSKLLMSQNNVPVETSFGVSGNSIYNSASLSLTSGTTSLNLAPTYAQLITNVPGSFFSTINVENAYLQLRHRRNTDNKESSFLLSPLAMEISTDNFKVYAQDANFAYRGYYMIPSSSSALRGGIVFEDLITQSTGSWGYFNKDAGIELNKYLSPSNFSTIRLNDNISLTTTGFISFQTANSNVTIDQIVQKGQIYTQSTEPVIPDGSFAFWVNGTDFYLLLRSNSIQKKVQLQ